MDTDDTKQRDSTDRKEGAVRKTRGARKKAQDASTERSVEEQAVTHKYEFREVTEFALTSANIPRRLWDTSSYKTLHPSSLEIPQKWLAAWSMSSLSIFPACGILLLGSNPSAEFLMIELLKRVYRRHRKIFCVSAEEIDRICKENLYSQIDCDTFGFLTEKIHCLGVYDFPSKGNRFGSSTFADRLIARRWDNQLPTIFVSKNSEDTLQDVFSASDIPLNVVRAIAEYTQKINIGGAT